MLDSRDNHYTMESDVNLYTQPLFSTWKYNRETKKGEKLIPPGIEPGTLSVLDSRDNHYTMESDVNLHTQPPFGSIIIASLTCLLAFYTITIFTISIFTC